MYRAGMLFPRRRHSMQALASYCGRDNSSRAWMSRFETAFRAGHLIMPRSVDGFRFKPRPSHEAQAFRERGEMGATTISFLYRIPNG